MLIKKQDITALPLQELSELSLVDCESWCEENKLSHFSGWLLPQLVAYFGNWKLKFSNGVLDPLLTLKHNIQTPHQRGIWKLTRVKRGLLVPLQIKQPEYGSFSPLIMLGFKRSQNLPYESWRGLERLDLILEPHLYEILHLDDYSLLNLGSETLLQLREQGLVTKTGKTAGKRKPAETTWALSGMQGTPLGGYPKLLQTMVTQCWLAHPTYRNHSMILDPLNWDRIPDPLVDSEVLEPLVVLNSLGSKKNTDDLPF